jgi:hypothetical protein
MKTATEQDTFDHIFGSGATHYSWWLGVKWVKGISEGGTVDPGWECEVKADDGNDGTATVTVTHKTIMAAVRKIAEDKGEDKGGIKYLGDATKREARNLIFDADEADLDAAIADQVLQFIVLGEIVFG